MITSVQTGYVFILQASLAVWVSLLRFMGDIPDAKGEHGAKVSNS